MQARAQHAQLSSHHAAAAVGGGGGGGGAAADGGDPSLSFNSHCGAALDVSAEGGCLADSTLDITGGIAAADVSAISRGSGRHGSKARKLDASFRVSVMCVV